ncbi:hypothetical protein NLU13_1503 [Sarocladium strictum]|uniref:Hydrophobin n=1 Tax=Sarocladium strictum TaxID=5046 RepID=A0AA39GR39_SARSR|nr:hypothetical protein NLU13_1503 [Sarocladium strictum]
MRLSIFTLLLAGALASPIEDPNAAADDDQSSPAAPPVSQYDPCTASGFFGSQANCCSVDIIGAASLGCKPPARTPKSPKEFKLLCGSKTPKCCHANPVGGFVHGFCATPVGV